MQKLLVCVAFAGAALGGSVASAQHVTTEVVVSGLTRPVFVTSPPGDRARLFVVEQRFTTAAPQAGRLRVIDLATSTVSADPYLVVRGLPVGDGTFSGLASGNEQGLLGLAFHPDFMENGYLYVHFTRSRETGVSAGSIIIARFRATGGDPMAATADPASMQVLLTVPDSDSNHNGGWIAFGPDGNLYIGIGDGGAANDTNGSNTELAVGHNPLTGNAQDVTNNLLGKILRIDVDGPDNIPGNADDSDPQTGKPYRIPAGNPFDGVNGDREIWAFGVRNPWRDSFDRETGDLWIADVGQNVEEEINVAIGNPPGRNYGWRCMEGTRCTGFTGCECDSAPLTLPIHTYDHTPGGACSISGGYVYRGCSMPWLRGSYFFADFCAATVSSLRQSGGVVTDMVDRTAEMDPPGAAVLGPVTSFGEDDLAELYVIDRTTTTSPEGKVLRIVDASPGAPDCNGNGEADGCDIARGVSMDANGNGIPDECEVCFADYNRDGGVDGEDVSAFYSDWEAGLTAADVNRDGGVDGADVDAFFLVWENGGC